MFGNYWQSILGLVSFFFIAFLMSENKKKISLKYVLIGVVTQFVLAFLFLKLPLLSQGLLWFNGAVTVLQQVTNEASQFMFGYLAGGPAPFDVSAPNQSFIVAFQVLPLILVVSAISSVLFYMGILPFIIRNISHGLRKIFPISGPLGFGAGSTLFLGTIEAPILIKPYLSKMTRSEIFSLLTCTMSTIAGTVMVLYSSVLVGVVENAIVHMITASVISIPAALALSHVMIPETESNSAAEVEMNDPNHSVLEALVRGTTEGLQMILHIVAVIIVLFALIYLFNRMLPFGWSLESGLGEMLRPFMWLTGIPWGETSMAGQLMATKIMLNEFVAFIELGKAEYAGLSPRTRLILTYALCGFANFASVGIVIGGLSQLFESKRQIFIRLAGLSLISGNLSTLSTACVVSFLT